MNFNNFTIKSQEAVQEAVNLVQSRGQQAIEPEHLMAGVLKVGENVTNFIFQKLGINGQQIETVLDRQIASLPKVSGGEPYLSRDANEVLQKAIEYSKGLGDEYVSLEALLLALLNVKSTVSTMLKDAGLTDKERGQILSINQANHPGRFYREVWIGLGGTHSAVYATEVSDEEYAVYTTEESEKLELQKLAKELGGNLELAVKRIAEMRRERKRSNGKA